MRDQDVNPLGQRHLALSARFKAAWAFHQLLVGMHRMVEGADFENRSARFQRLLSRLKRFSESLHGATTGRDEQRSTELAEVTVEIDQLCEELVEQDEKVSPSELRRFFVQVRSLDDRILIEVVRFYLEIQQERDWPRDRLDKIDFLLSRLAERIAGPDLQSDRRRLDKVLQGLLSSAGPVQEAETDLEGSIEALQDLRSEVRWVKTFEELNESGMVEVYRALKHEMAAQIFHPRILPLVVEVNNAFRRKIDELRSHEELRLLEDYRQVNQLQESSKPQAAALQTELTMLQQQVEKFRVGTKAKDVRLSELAELGDSLREIAKRLQTRAPNLVEKGTLSFPRTQQAGAGMSGSMGLVPDFDCLQPHWGELLKGLSDLDEEISPEKAVSEAVLVAFRLEAREVVAFRRTAGAEPADVGLEQFILAAASLRHRIGQEAADLRGLLSQSPGSKPEAVLRRAGEAARIADAYVKHFSHLSEQAVFGGQLEEAKEFLMLQARLQRERSGLVILLPRISEAASSKMGDNLASISTATTPS